MSALRAPLLDGFLRLVRLLDAPTDIPVLAPLILREIEYRLLQTEQFGRLAQMAIGDGRPNVAILGCIPRSDHDDDLREVRLGGPHRLLLLDECGARKRLLSLLVESESRNESLMAGMLTERNCLFARSRFDRRDEMGTEGVNRRRGRTVLRALSDIRDEVRGAVRLQDVRELSPAIGRDNSAVNALRFAGIG